MRFMSSAGASAEYHNMSNGLIHENNEERFVRIPRDKWKYELESGQLTWEESDVLFWLWLKANPTTGKVAVNYAILSEEMKDRFPYVKERVNKINKIMLSLKDKQRLWFPEHSGSSKPAEVELDEFPLIQKGYTDITSRFQQNSSRGNLKNVSQNSISAAELFTNEQSFNGIKNQINALKNKMSFPDSSRGPNIDRNINKERNIDNFNSLFSSKEGSDAYKKGDRWKDPGAWEEMMARTKERGAKQKPDA